MILPHLKTVLAVTGGAIGLTMLGAGCYFIESIGKPLIFTGVIISIASAVYISLFAEKLQNITQISPDPIETSFV